MCDNILPHTVCTLMYVAYNIAGTVILCSHLRVHTIHTCLISLIILYLGFRHRFRTLHSLDFYLPSPCYGLSSNTIRVLMMDLQILLEENGCSKEQCLLENMFLQCPGVSSSVTFFSDIPSNPVVGK